MLQSLNEKKPEKLIWDNVVPFARRSKPSEFDPARMYKFITWNVAGLRGVLRKDASALSRFMKKEKPDILCLQETKLNPAEAKENQQLGVVPGYWFVDHVSHAKKGYSGTRVYIHTAGLGKEWHVATTCGLAFPAETTPVLLAPSHPLQSGAGGGGATASVERTVREGSDQVRWPPDEEGRVQTIWLQPRTSTGLLAGASGVFPVRTPSCIEGGEKTGTSTTSRKRSREVASSPTSPASPDKKKRKIENGEDGTSWPMGCEDTANKGGVLGSAIASFFPSLAVVNTYIPNSGMTLDRLPYRIEHFDAAMRSYLYDMQQYCQRNAQEWMETQEKSTKEKRSSRSPDRNSSGRRRSTSPMKETTPALYPSGVIWTGDLNVAEKDFDRYYAGTWKKMQECSGFTPEERFSFRETLDHLGGACDAFRMLYPQAGPTYTFWSSRISGREKGLGWRLDYFVVSKNLMPFVVDVFPMPEVQGSDHCPVQMWLKKQLDD